ncbi:hypothetical protein EVAR_59419_1 [Eumeta japonica]|uniref:Uncharacterized protein n=1 Tax=Eumeta variegata TaxID=151549 RepID=A0A4C1Z452_EUMVA|nr:hypothetical protein EVAR_59419_1 [Eumeta japonica]
MKGVDVFFKGYGKIPEVSDRAYDKPPVPDIVTALVTSVGRRVFSIQEWVGLRQLDEPTDGESDKKSYASQKIDPHLRRFRNNRMQGGVQFGLFVAHKRVRYFVIFAPGNIL